MSAFLRRHVELIPLAAVVGAGVVMAAGFIGDVATNGYMLSWTSKNPEPWNNVDQTRNTKFLGLQTAKHEEVFKPQSSDDLRGRL